MDQNNRLDDAEVLAAARDCRPPEGTPDGTVCVLLTADMRLNAKWVAPMWIWSHDGMEMGASPAFMADMGYRFHSIAEPPHD